MLSLYAVSVTQIPSRNNIMKFFCECTWHAAQAVEMEILKQGLSVPDAKRNSSNSLVFWKQDGNCSPNVPEGCN